MKLITAQEGLPMLTLRGCLALSALLMTSCGAAEPQRSQGPTDRIWVVVDRNTKEPIPSAWISIQYFQGIAAPGHGTTACMRSESFQAGVDARFEAPADGRFGQASPTASKLGYTQPLGRVNDASKREVYLVPFAGTQEEVFFNALQGSYPSRCDSDEDQLRELPKRKYFLDQAAKLIDPKNAAQVSRFDGIKEGVERFETRMKATRR